MTARGRMVLVGSVAAVLLGAWTDWPGLTGLGAAGIVVVLLVRVLMGPHPRGDMAIDQTALRVIRGQPASVRIDLAVHRRRGWLRLVDGDVRAPRRSSQVPRMSSDRQLTVEVPLDTSRRGQAPMGPYALVQGDPWSFIRRVVSRAEGGVLTVQPRVYRIRRSLTADFSSGDAEARSRRAGDQHFHALREYVLGDEPRTVHWRSSARAGKLVVRQQVAAAAAGTVIVLDVDATSYGSPEKFGPGWLDERFESAVEVAASLAASQLAGTDQVHLVTTSSTMSVISSSVGAVNRILDALALVTAVSPNDTLPAELPAVVRRARCAQLIVVTGMPGERLLGPVRQVGRDVATTVVLVGSPQSAQLPGCRVVSVSGAEDLI